MNGKQSFDIGGNTEELGMFYVIARYVLPYVLVIAGLVIGFAYFKEIINYISEGLIGLTGASGF